MKITAETRMNVHLSADDLTDLALKFLRDKVPDMNLKPGERPVFIPRWLEPAKSKDRKFGGIDVVFRMEDEEVE